MALAVHPEFPDAGYAFLQGENGRDLPDMIKPNEEINAIEKGRHYGWPYCYDLSTPSPEFAASCNPGAYKNLCTNKAIYKQPLFAAAAARARRSACSITTARKFPGAGRQAAWSACTAIVRPAAASSSMTSTTKGFPKPARRRCVTTSVARPSRRAVSDRAAGDVAAAPFNELIADWHSVNGARPQGAPVGMTVAADGAIWLVEDKNQTIIRIDRAAGDPRAVALRHAQPGA